MVKDTPYFGQVHEKIEVFLPTLYRFRNAVAVRLLLSRGFGYGRVVSKVCLYYTHLSPMLSSRYVERGDRLHAEHVPALEFKA